MSGVHEHVHQHGEQSGVELHDGESVRLKQLFYKLL
jgi:hypothetical protein